MKVKAWCVWDSRFPDFRHTINATTRGRAKREYYRILRDAWPDTRYIDLRAEVLGDPQSTPEFIRCAEARGLPNLRCGAAVRVGSEIGVVVDYDLSQNFKVEFLDGRRLHVHPAYLALVEDK